MDPFNLNKIKLIVKYLPIFQRNKMLMLPATSLNYWLSEVDILQEKLDILEEHISQLMSEIKKKNRVIQSYVMNIEPGALVSEESDIHKVGNWYFHFFDLFRVSHCSLYIWPTHLITTICLAHSGTVDKGRGRVDCWVSFPTIVLSIFLCCLEL